MKHVLNAIPQAAAEAARSMTYDLRESALEHGWHPAVANSIRVLHTGTEFKVHVPAKYAAEAHKYEYGTEDRRPTAVIRKFNNRPEIAEKAILGSLNRITKGLL